MTTGINAALIVIYWPLAGKQEFGREFWNHMKNYVLRFVYTRIIQFSVGELERRLQDIGTLFMKLIDLYNVMKFSVYKNYADPFGFQKATVITIMLPI